MSTNDRVLLELAAKASGIEYTVKDDDYYKTHSFFGLWLTFHDEPSEYARRYWNPLTDDGDALRLAVKLEICVTIFKDSEPLGSMANMHFEKFNGDWYATTRRAVVRAAAEIGKQ